MGLCIADRSEPVPVLYILSPCRLQIGISQREGQFAGLAAPDGMPVDPKNRSNLKSRTAKTKISSARWSFTVRSDFTW